MYQYWGFGLHIESEIEFPELLPYQFEKADVTISVGEVPEFLTTEIITERVNLKVSAKEYLLNLPGIAKYYAQNGLSITISPYADADMASVRIFLLSNSIAAILHQLKRIPFHASGIVYNGKVFLFTGNSGAGKSTTLFGLQSRGYKIFTDDVCVLQKGSNDNRIVATPSYPYSKLWQDTLDVFEKDYSALPKIRPCLPKFGIYYHDDFSTDTLAISVVFILSRIGGNDSLKYRKLNPIESFNVLQENSYRRRQVDMMDIRQTHFDIISTLASQVAVYEIKVPSNFSVFDDVLDYLESCIKL